MSAYAERRRSGPHPVGGLLLGATLWVVLAGVGFAELFAYAARPGTSGVGAKVASTSGKPVLRMILHPRCACSRASLRELERLLAHVEGPLDVRVVFVGPAGGEHGLLDQARAIPGVAVEQDPTGEVARGLGAETSGDVLFYDATGALRFHGGLTAVRGHEGPSAARQAILDLVAHRSTPSAATTTAAFGCRLGVTQ